MLTTWAFAYSASAEQLSRTGSSLRMQSSLPAHANDNGAQRRDYRDREEHAGNAGHLLASEHAEEHQQRVKFDTRAQQVRAEHIILEQAVDDQENQNPQQVSIAAETGNQE